MLLVIINPLKCNRWKPSLWMHQVHVSRLKVQSQCSRDIVIWWNLIRVNAADIVIWWNLISAIHDNGGEHLQFKEVQQSKEDMVIY